MFIEHITSCFSGKITRARSYFSAEQGVRRSIRSASNMFKFTERGEMTMKINMPILIAAVFLLMPFTISADRCPAGKTGCTVSDAPGYTLNRIIEGAINILNDNN